MSINRSNRWEIAQSYEKNWWQSRVKEVDFNFYKKFAEELLHFISDEIQITSKTKILEIGSGAGGIVTYLSESNNRFAIDPLEDFYSEQDSFFKQRDTDVKYQVMKGENLLFDNSEFDLIIMDNVLDHCEEPKLVMKEAKRVLKENGIIFFKQNTYHYWGKAIRILMEKFTIDKGHPFTFSKTNLKSIIMENKLSIIKKSSSGYLDTWKKEIRANTIKDKIKAILFVNRDKVTYLLK